MTVRRESSSTRVPDQRDLCRCPTQASSSLPPASTSSAARACRPAAWSRRWARDGYPVAFRSDQSAVSRWLALAASLAVSADARQPGALHSEPDQAGVRQTSCTCSPRRSGRFCWPRCRRWWSARLMGRRVILHYHSGEADEHLAHWGVLVHPWLRLADVIVVPSEYLAGVFARPRLRDAGDSQRRGSLALRVPRASAASSAAAVDAEPRAVLPGGRDPRSVRAPAGAACPRRR